MPNEVTPGMNTQAKKPAFDPKSDIEQIPMQPAMAPEPTSIREYLQTLKAGQVPTFTNVPGQEGTFSPEQGAMVFKDLSNTGQITPYGPDEAGPQAIPEPGQDPADSSVTGSDPYEMAAQRLPHILDDVWQTTFPGRQPGDFSQDPKINAKEQKEWKARVNHVSNDLVKRYEEKIKRTEKDGLQLIKDFTGESVDQYRKSGKLGDLEKRIDWNDVYGKAITQYEKLGEYDPIKDTMSAEEYAQNRVDTLKRELERQKINDAKQRLGGKETDPMAGIPEELHGQVAEMMELAEELKGMKSTSGGKGMTPQQISDLLAKQYPELVPYF